MILHIQLAQALSAYLNLNLLILFAFLALACFSFLQRQAGCEIRAKTELNLSYFFVSLVMFFSLLQPLLPQNKIFLPVARVWSARSLQSFSRDYERSARQGYVSVPELPGSSSINAADLTSISLAVFAVLFFLGAILLGRGLFRLRALRNRAYLIRKLGRVSIFCSDECAVPFTYWTVMGANVIIPPQLLENFRNYRIAVSHELQHHRQHDTKWVYVLLPLRIFCAVNPALYFWNRWISQLQEFACDETLVDRKKVESQAYARCLFEIAKFAVHQRAASVCATEFSFLVEGHILKRRIEKMLKTRSAGTNQSLNVIFTVVLTSLLTVTAFASKNLVLDRRIGMDEAVSLAKVAQGRSEFPVVVNDLVLKQLNRYVGTAEGREFMRSTLKRLETHRSMLERKLGEYGAPGELMAVPIVESGYQNLPESNKAGWGAGLWMFIAPTARIFGLRVDRQIDQRLDAELLTDAAIRYLESNHLRFKDWQLAILAYNVGEKALQSAIDKTGSRDPWVLIRQGYENDRDYLPRVMAAILIMRNADLLK
jgi:membrane-bound lytic murein transglycosylase D